MAGFTNRAKDLVNLPMVPYPAVTLFVDLGDGVLIDEASCQQQRRSLAVGLAPSGVRGRGRHIECLQVARQWSRTRRWAPRRSWAGR